MIKLGRISRETKGTATNRIVKDASSKQVGTCLDQAHLGEAVFANGPSSAYQCQSIKPL